MRISDLLQNGPSFSFEFFPPKDETGMEQLFETVAHLAPHRPTFVSVTYGAGGSTRRLTVDLVERIQRETGIVTMAHLTCVGSPRTEIAEVLGRLRSGGVENVLALRGDPPKGATSFVAPEGGFSHGSELAAFVRQVGAFCVAGACYPEKHPEAPDRETDLLRLRAKVDAGAEFLITQLFFDVADYFSFVERARTAGIVVPILAGIMPVTNLSQLKRFTSMCGAKIPEVLLARLDGAGGDADAVRAIGVEHATAQCRELLARGCPGIHFYTLNRSPSTVRVMDALVTR